MQISVARRKERKRMIAPHESCKLARRKYRLTTVNPSAYSVIVAETTATGFGSPKMLADNRRSAVFLRPYAFARLYDQWVGDGGEASACRCQRSGLPTLSSARPPHLEVGSGFNPNVGGRTMSRHTPARPEQPQSLSDIVRDALRAAALAPDTASALDVAGAALCDIAQLTRSHQPTQPARGDDRSLRTVERTMDNTEGVLERAACLFEAIDRLTRDGDDAVTELALIGRSLVAQQSEAVDHALMTLHSYMASTEAARG